MENEGNSYLSRVMEHFNNTHNLVAPKFVVYEETAHERHLRKYSYQVMNDTRDNNNMIENKSAIRESVSCLISNQSPLITEITESKEEQINDEDKVEMDELLNEEFEEEVNIQRLKDVIALTFETVELEEVSKINEAALPLFTRKNNTLHEHAGDESGAVNIVNHTNMNCKHTLSVYNNENIEAHVREFSILLCILQRMPSTYRENINFNHFLRSLWVNNFTSELIKLVHEELFNSHRRSDREETMQCNQLLNLYCEVLLLYVYHCNRCKSLHRYVIEKNAISNVNNNISEILFKESDNMLIMHVLKECILRKRTKSQTYMHDNGLTGSNNILEKEEENYIVWRPMLMLVCTVLEMMPSKLTLSQCNMMKDFISYVYVDGSVTITCNEYKHYSQLHESNVAVFILISTLTLYLEKQRHNVNTQEQFNFDNELEGTMRLILTCICQSTVFDWDLSETFRRDGPHSPAFTIVSGKLSRTMEHFLWMTNASVWKYFTLSALQHFTRSLSKFAYEWQAKLPISLTQLIIFEQNELQYSVINKNINHYKIMKVSVLHHNDDDDNNNNIQRIIYNMTLYFNTLAALPYINEDFITWQSSLICNGEWFNKIYSTLNIANKLENNTAQICRNNQQKLNVLLLAIDVMEHICNIQNDEHLLNWISNITLERTDKCENILGKQLNKEQEEQEEHLEQQQEQEQPNEDEQGNGKENGETNKANIIRFSNNCMYYSKYKNKVEQIVELLSLLFESALTLLHSLLLCYRSQLNVIDQRLDSNSNNMPLVHRVLQICYQVMVNTNRITESAIVEKMALSLIERYTYIIETKQVPKLTISALFTEVLRKTILSVSSTSDYSLNRLLLRLYMCCFLHRRLFATAKSESASLTNEIDQNSWRFCKLEMLKQLCTNQIRSEVDNTTVSPFKSTPALSNNNNIQLTHSLFVLYYLEKIDECEGARSFQVSSRAHFTTWWEITSSTMPSNEFAENIPLFVSGLMQCVQRLYEMLCAGEVYLCNLSIMHLLEVALELLRSVIALNNIHELHSSWLLLSNCAIESCKLTYYNNNDNNNNNNNIQKQEESIQCQRNTTSALFALLHMLFTISLSETVIALIAEIVISMLSPVEQLPETNTNTNSSNIINNCNIDVIDDNDVYISIRATHTMCEIQKLAIKMHHALEVEHNEANSTLRLKVLHLLHKSCPRTLLLFIGSESIPENVCASSVSELRIIRILLKLIHKKNTLLSSLISPSAFSNSKTIEILPSSVMTITEKTINSNKPISFTMSDHHYEEKANALDLLRSLNMYETLTPMECENLLNDLQRRENECHDSATVRMSNQYNNNNTNNELSVNINNDDTNILEIQQRHRGRKGENAYSESSKQCSIALWVSSLLYYIAVSMVHELKQEEKEIRLHEAAHQTGIYVNDNRQSNDRTLTPNNVVEVSRDSNTPLLLGHARSSVFSVHSDLLHHALQEGIEQLTILYKSFSQLEERLETCYEVNVERSKTFPFTDHLKSKENINCICNVRRWRALGAHNRNTNSNCLALPEDERDEENKEQLIFNHNNNNNDFNDDDDVAEMTSVSNAADISLQFTDNYYDESPNSSEVESEPPLREYTTEKREKCYYEPEQQQQQQQQQQQEQQQEEKDQMEKIMRERNLYNASHLQVIVNQERKIGNNSRINSNGRTKVRKNMKQPINLTHHLCPLLCGVNYYFYGISNSFVINRSIDNINKGTNAIGAAAAFTFDNNNDDDDALLNVAASHLMCMRVICRRLVALVCISGHDSDVNVLFVTRSTDLIRAALQCVLLERKSRNTVASLLTPLYSSLLEEALNLLRTVATVSRRRYVDEVQSTLVVELRPMLHTLIAFLQTNVISQPAILMSSTPLLCLLHTDNLYDMSIIQKVFPILARVLQYHNKFTSNAATLLTCANCNAVIDCSLIYFDRFGAHCPLLLMLSIVQLIWQRIMTTLHCVSATDRIDSKPVICFSKLVRLLMTIFTSLSPPTSTSLPFSKPTFVLFSALHQGEFFTLLSSFEDCHTFHLHTTNHINEQCNSITHRPAWQYVWCMMIKLLTLIITQLLHNSESLSQEPQRYANEQQQTEPEYSDTTSKLVTNASGWLQRTLAFVSSSVRYKEAIGALDNYNQMFAILQEGDTPLYQRTQHYHIYCHFWKVEEVYVCTRLLSLLRSCGLHLTSFIPLVSRSFAVYCKAQINIRSAHVPFGGVNNSGYRSNMLVSPSTKPFTSPPATSSASFLPTTSEKALTSCMRENNMLYLYEALQRRLCKVYVMNIVQDQLTFLLNQIDHTIYTQHEWEEMNEVINDKFVNGYNNNNDNNNNSNYIHQNLSNNRKAGIAVQALEEVHALTLNLLCNFIERQLIRLRRSSVQTNTGALITSGNISVSSRANMSNTSFSSTPESLSSSRETSATQTPSIAFADTNSLSNSFVDEFVHCNTLTSSFLANRNMHCNLLDSPEEISVNAQLDLIDTLRVLGENVRNVHIDSVQMSLCLFTLAAEEMTKRAQTSAMPATLMYKRELNMLCDKLLHTLEGLSKNLKKIALPRLESIVRVMQTRLNNVKVDMRN